MIYFVTLLALPIFLIWSGYVLSVMWGWFIVTSFSAPALSIPAAIGVAATVRFITFQAGAEDQTEEEVGIKIIRAWLYGIFYPAITLLFGWIVKAFM